MCLLVEKGACQSTMTKEMTIRLILLVQKGDGWKE